VGWEKYQAFVTQLITAVSRVEQKSDLHLNTFSEGGNGVIQIEDFNPEESFLDVEARVSGPQQRTVTVPLKQTGPRRYQAEFPLWGTGRYQVAAAGAGQDRSEHVSGGFALSYSPEYLHFRSNPILLGEIARRTGGRVLNGEEADLYHVDRQPRESTRPASDWFFIVIAILIPIDVGVRRIQLDWTVVRGWFRIRRKQEASGQTFGALLQRKQQVQTTMEVRREPAAMPPQARPATPESPPGPKPKPAPDKPAKEDAPDPLSTTERLLAKKRKRKEDEK
jgi:hypothetical protein